MKIGIFLLLLVISVFACDKGTRDHRIESDDLSGSDGSSDSLDSSNYPDSLKYLVVKANRLRLYYRLPKEDSVERGVYERLFFGEFPSDQKTFRVVYCNGMYQYGLENLLIDESDLHVHFLLDGLRSIDIKRIYNKIIDISKDAQWDPDDVLQEYLQELVDKDGSILFSVLAERSDESTKGFFLYLFGGPHPPEVLPIAVVDLRDKFPKVVSLAKEALKELQVNE